MDPQLQQSQQQTTNELIHPSNNPSSNSNNNNNNNNNTGYPTYPAQWSYGYQNYPGYYYPYAYPVPINNTYAMLGNSAATTTPTATAINATPTITATPTSTTATTTTITTPLLNTNPMHSNRPVIQRIVTSQDNLSTNTAALSTSSNAKINQDNYDWIRKQKEAMAARTINNNNPNSSIPSLNTPTTPSNKQEDKPVRFDKPITRTLLSIPKNANPKTNISNFGKNSTFASTYVGNTPQLQQPPTSIPLVNHDRGKVDNSVSINDDRNCKKEMSDWLQKCYEYFNDIPNTNENDRSNLQKVLREKVADVTTKKMISLIDWKKEPMPAMLLDLYKRNQSRKKRLFEFDKEPTDIPAKVLRRSTFETNVHSSNRSQSPQSLSNDIKMSSFGTKNKPYWLGNRNVIDRNKNTNALTTDINGIEGDGDIVMNDREKASHMENNSDADEGYGSAHMSISISSSEEETLTTPSQQINGKQKKKKMKGASNTENIAQRNVFMTNDETIDNEEDDDSLFSWNDIKTKKMKKKKVKLTSIEENGEAAKIIARKARFQTGKGFTKNARLVTMTDQTGNFSRNFNKKKTNGGIINQTNNNDIPNVGVSTEEPLDWHALRVVGTSKKLEKHYLRLTCAPEPSEVRDEETCKRAHSMLLNRWKTQRDYVYVGDQFKSLRQDLKVQHIRNQLTVDVYESNARICLEVGDLSEYNQCQSQLKELYKLSESFRQNFVEFLSYRLLYFAITKNSVGILDTLKTNGPFRTHTQIMHVRSIIDSMQSMNYVKFFRLYKISPHYIQCMLNQIVHKIRYLALVHICNAYGQTQYSVEKLVKTLGFDTKTQCVEYLKQSGIRFKTPLRLDMIDCKPSKTTLREFVPKSNDDQLGITHGSLYHEKESQKATLEKFLLKS